MKKEQKAAICNIVLAIYATIWILFTDSSPLFAAACRPADVVVETGDAYTWTGGCKDGLFDGEGLFRLTRNGKPLQEYFGTFVEGMKSGKGSMTFADGSRYFGEFLQGAVHGTGTMTFSSGDRYTGEFVVGKIHGQGVHIFASEDRYIGPFLEGKMHGIGIYRPAGGERQIVEYADGIQIKMWADTAGAFRSDHPVLANVDSDLARRVVRLSLMVHKLFGLEPVYTSGFRSAEKNNEVGGVLQSLHLEGRAVDLVVPGLPSEKEETVADLSRQLGLYPLWHGEGANHHLHLSLGE